MGELYYGRGKDEDNKKLIEFLDEVFFTDDPGKRDFFNLLPKIYKDSDRPAYNNFVVQDGKGEFRAAIGNFYNYMTVGEENMLTCCIGNVAVGKSYRSKGYMIELMNMSVDDMIKNDTDMAYLGGQRQRYGYFGFESAGVRYSFGFNRQTVKHALGGKPGELKAVQLKEDDFAAIEAIDEIYSRNPVRSQRPMDKYFDILCSWRSTPYILLDGKDFIGYFVLNHEGESVLECGVTEPKYIGDMIIAVFETTESYGVDFQTAPSETDKVRFFTENCEGMGIGGCESILVFNYEKVIRAYLKAKTTYSRLCDGEMTVLIHGKKADEKLKISVINNEVSVTKFDGDPEYEFSHHEATRLFFSNYTAERETVRPELQQWLPLPVTMFGTDTM